ncbi:MAG: hypothetical protein HRU03_00390 [Nanoarchaeales archaeon]|nr:hypothetical protein [Nanoarchaeales archaeon]
MNKILIIMTIFLIVFTGCSTNENSSEIVKEIKDNTIGSPLMKKELFSGDLEIKIPSSFEIMDDEIAQIKYPSINRPELIYTNSDGSTNLAFKRTESSVTNNQISEVKDLFSQMFKNLYPSATWYDENIYEVNGKNIGVLEFSTPAIDTEIYNYMFFFEMNGKVTLVTFNTLLEQKGNWEVLAEEIRNSVKIK